MRDRLTSEQIEWLGESLGDFTIREDLSWGFTPSSVWKVEDRSGMALVVKAATAQMRHHISREIDAHESVTTPLVTTHDAQRLVAASRELGIVVVTYVPGVLGSGSELARTPDAHARAGRLLARIHPQGSRLDRDYEQVQTEQSRRWLDSPHRIPDDSVRTLREILDRYDPQVIRVVPTHGDWQPRNWVIDEISGRVRVIDFGRFAWRPAQSDLVCCWSQEWRHRGDLEAAHMAGYGADPRDETWPIECLRQAIGTAAWACQMKDEPFERQGIEMIGRALQLFE